MIMCENNGMFLILVMRHLTSIMRNALRNLSVKHEPVILAYELDKINQWEVYYD